MMNKKAKAVLKRPNSFLINHLLVNQSKLEAPLVLLNCGEPGVPVGRVAHDGLWGDALLSSGDRRHLLDRPGGPGPDSSFPDCPAVPLPLGGPVHLHRPGRVHRPQLLILVMLASPASSSSSSSAPGHWVSAPVPVVVLLGGGGGERVVHIVVVLLLALALHEQAGALHEAVHRHDDVVEL